MIFVEPVQAQLPTNFSGAGAYQPELTFRPMTPEPGEEVTVKIGNFVSALQGSEINWTVNRIPLEDFKNQTEIIIRAGEVDELVMVTARLQTLSGDSVTASGEVTARYLDIIIEPQTHVPEFYTGRALPSVGSQVNVTALLNGIVDSQYVYTWRVNDAVVGNIGGRGQYTTQFEMPLDSRPILSLDVFTLTGKLYASKSVIVPNVQPFIRFYEVHNLYGLSDKSYDSLILNGNSATLRAVPYFLDSRVYNNAPNAVWSVGNQPVGTNGNPYELTIERTGETGRVSLNFNLRSTTALLQGVSGSLPVFY